MSTDRERKKQETDTLPPKNCNLEKRMSALEKKVDQKATASPEETTNLNGRITNLEAITASKVLVPEMAQGPSGSQNADPPVPSNEVKNNVTPVLSSGEKKVDTPVLFNRERNAEIPAASNLANVKLSAPPTWAECMRYNVPVVPIPLGFPLVQHQSQSLPEIWNQPPQQFHQGPLQPPPVPGQIAP